METIKFSLYIALIICIIVYLRKKDMDNKIRKMDENPYNTVKSDKWYKENNTTPYEQEQIRKQKTIELLNIEEEIRNKNKQKKH